MKPGKKDCRVIQLGNAYPSKRKNSNNGRIYDPEGIAACLHTATGGWKLPLILLRWTQTE